MERPARPPSCVVLPSSRRRSRGRSTSTAPTGRPAGPCARPAARVLHFVISTVCLQCGTPSDQGRGAFCRRCGLPYGQPPRATAELPTCPICYRTVDDDGRLPSLERHGVARRPRPSPGRTRPPSGRRRRLARIAPTRATGYPIGKWHAPFDTVRRYLVTGQVDAGRNRALAHDAIVTAMTQIKRWGPHGDIFGDLPDWKAARQAVVEMMERYARGRA